MRLASRLVGLVVVILLIFGGWAVAWRPAIAPAEGQPTFPKEQILRGAELAAIGDCAVCHTAAGGRPYAGGRGVATPFGTVYASNITPDPDTAIGLWSLAAFTRSMRDGIGRTGRHLYPVLPYPHFTRATDQDIAAIYAFLMTRAPVRAVTPANHIPVPRVLLAGWNVLFLSPGPWHPDPARDEVWNRGAYLVEAIGHCGACHTPHNLLGAEKSGQSLAGGEAENWYAPPLQSASPAREPWTASALARYLRTGFEGHHGAAAGPMTEVTRQLAGVPQADIDAMAAYIAGQMPAHAEPGVIAAQGPPNPVFAGACAACHGVEAPITPDGAEAPMTRYGAPSLALSSAINAATPDGVIQTILHGIPWRDGEAGPYMPPFAGVLTDQQVAELAGWLRRTYSDKPGWTDLPREVAKLRSAS